MEKVAPALHPINPLITRRWSPRAFDPDRPVDLKTLGILFEAARWAPSLGNLQPWRFIVGVNFDGCHQDVLSMLGDKNQTWTKNAPVLFIAVANLTKNGDVNSHALHDMGLALENLFLQATDLSLCCHYMASFSSDKARLVFRIPDNFQPITAGALGYPGDINLLPEDLRERELRLRVRKPLRELVFTSTWENPLDGIDGEER